ncbi:multidrug ABC transporter ATPase [Amycolatopsis mediterranei S699]|uniref:ATPase component of ABC-type multidrug transport system n=2 Tax=Amycolatopsis mediterranei TaxID=33910 RepID=A0A0H3DFA0_AMYMU|nr:ABC transporter ATP-binding protein [Amycolatopsis mediterranei]ADJ48309.1 ATPase component of ABC-type multidrug transport system [Amycolatopsis mediterranei U32]AEK45227.1 multidrug ABC transporter ATPase [Amycolatopsis mediterranei S699]AFO80020.1 multidrug ABC transporter ATPase [Amycolatopsis mediterranei S699]AGT87148.1 multidrug ABC transporter ATPase [Amycolatopsis mediterranei RB]KDO10828.1 bacitracin ABC transporter ATP-binding protein [Amycolatopsis mediterranei]
MTIDAIDLTKQYRDVLAVDDVTLRVAPGEIYALLGLNGAGKTTTIRMLLGLLRPTHGQVRLFGEQVEPGRNAVWAQVGYLVETPSAYPELTVTENLQVIARLRGLRNEKTVTDAIARLGLQPHAHHRAQTLSLGNKQRLGLAKALLHQPELLILDEPANGLDPAGVAEIRTLLHDLAHHDGVTILLSSHILTEVARLADRIGVLDHGRLAWEGSTADLTAQARPQLRIAVRDRGRAAATLRAAGHPAEDDGDGGLILTGDHAIRHPDEIATRLVTAGCPPTHLAVEQDDLETCFLRLVDPR